MYDNNKGELHLLVLWEKARPKERDIVDDLRNNLPIIASYDIQWSEDQALKNFCRFHGLKLKYGLEKIRESGRGRFLALAVWDDAPKYSLAQTGRGLELVNRNIFNLKTKYQDWAGGSDSIFATNNPSETDRALTLLLGLSSDDFLNQAQTQAEAGPVRIDRDLVGTGAWASVGEIFYALNHTVNYVVMDDIECPLELDEKSTHGAVDLLVDDVEQSLLVLNARKAHRGRHQAGYTVRVGQGELRFNLRHPGDDYYCRPWEKSLLSRRRLSSKGYFALNSNDHYYALIYHAQIHKNGVSPDYYARASALLKELDLDTGDEPDLPQVFDRHFWRLKKYMTKHSYYFTRPADPSVDYNDYLALSNDMAEYLADTFGMSDIHPILTERQKDIGYYFFQADFKDQKLFIKWDKNDSFCRREALTTHKLWSINPENFLEPILYRFNNGLNNFLALPFLEGTLLSDGLDKMTPEEKESAIAQLKNIAETLIAAGVVHRDIHLENLFWIDKKRLCLIDFQFAVNYKRYKEPKIIMANPKRVAGIGGDFALGRYKWDDMYSLKKILEKIGPEDSYRETYDQVHNYFSSNIGKYEVGFGLKLSSVRTCRSLIRSFYKRTRQLCLGGYEWASENLLR